MAPQAAPTPDASRIGISIYSSATRTATTTATTPSSTSSTPSASDNPNSTGNTWSNYLYIVVIFAAVFLLLGFLYQRKRRNLATSSSSSTSPSRNRYQVFHTHHPSQSRDLAAVEANNRVWRNLRAGPFSHHARADSAAASRMAGTSSTEARSRVDLVEEGPPPYVVAEPERTLERSPSTRETRDLRSDGEGRRDVGLDDLLRGSDSMSTNKPPGYEERDGESRRSRSRS